MHRVDFVGMILVLALLGVAAFGQSGGVGAQDTSDQHPMVGSWLVYTNPDNPDDELELLVVSADGSWLEVDGEGSVGIGAWESTGPQTTNVNIWFLIVDDLGSFEGTFIIRAAVEVAVDGQSWTASYNAEFVAPDGTGSGEYGTSVVTAKRLSVEPMGTPGGPFEDLFAQLEEATAEP